MTKKDDINRMEVAFTMLAEEKALGTGWLHADSRDTEFHIKSGGLTPGDRGQGMI